MREGLDRAGKIRQNDAMTTRYFTPNDANRTLPLVRRIVEDILALGCELREQNALSSDEQTRNRLRQIHGEILSLLEEMEQIGCSYKDFSFTIGLVDFPSLIDGEPVLLCWRSDEERITWYHSADEGFAGRKRIPGGLLESSDLAAEEKAAGS